MEARYLRWLMMSLLTATVTEVVVRFSSATKADVWITTPDKRKLLHPEPPVSFAPCSGNDDLTKIIIDDSREFQKVDGFGAALTDSAAWLISVRLGAVQRATLMDSLFGAGGGRFSFLRITMGASDFSLRDYTYADRCCDLSNFSIEHDVLYKIPLLQQAKNIFPELKIIATPWTPPVYMKSSEQWGSGTLLRKFYSMYAEYFFHFVDGYAKHGLPIHSITVQNEPHNEPRTYPGMRLPAQDEADFVKQHLGPLFKSKSLETRIVIWDHNWDDPQYPISILNDTEAYSYVYGSAFHCYAGNVAAQSVVHAAAPSKAIFFTECTGTVGSQFGQDLQWNMQNLIIGSIRAWSQSVLLWNLALDTNSGPTNGGCLKCRGVVTIDDSGHVTYNVEYYVLSHASRFVDPGGHRVSSSTYPNEIESVAFVNPDGTVVVIVLNAADAPKVFTVKWKAEAFNFSLPSGSVATFKWKS